MSLPLSPRAVRAVRRLAALGLLCLVVALLFGALAAPAAAQGPDPYGRDTDYRPLMSSGDNEWLNPRNAIWILAQLHLLFGAFVLAVPMFVVIIEFIGHRSKDREQGARYDALAHEFTRFMAIAFSFTAIVGAVFTMCCLYFYPKIWGYNRADFVETKEVLIDRSKRLAEGGRDALLEDLLAGYREAEKAA